MFQARHHRQPLIEECALAPPSLPNEEPWTHSSVPPMHTSDPDLPPTTLSMDFNKDSKDSNKEEEENGANSNKEDDSDNELLPQETKEDVDLDMD